MFLEFRHGQVSGYINNHYMIVDVNINLVYRRFAIDALTTENVIGVIYEGFVLFVNSNDENLIIVQAHISNLQKYSEKISQSIDEESDKINKALLKCNEAEEEVLISK